MTPEKFVDWLDGFIDRNSAPPSPAEWAIVTQKLASVFNKVTVKTVSAPGAGFPALPPHGDGERICSVDQSGIWNGSPLSKVIPDEAWVEMKAISDQLNPPGTPPDQIRYC